MHKSIFKTIGLLTFIFGIYSLYGIILGIIKSPTSTSFLGVLIKLAFALIAIYGGFQLFSTKEIGKKLLIVLFSYQVSLFAFFVLAIFYNLAYNPADDFGLKFPSLASTGLIVGFYLLCIPVLAFLLKVELGDNLHVDHYHRMQIIGKVLSILSPGLGQMLVSNIVLGFILFFLYSLLITATLTPSSSAVPNMLVDFLYKLIVWSIFSKIDWYMVEKYAKSAQEKFTLVPKLNSSQVNGG